VDLANSSFTGTVAINISVLMETDTIILHASTSALSVYCMFYTFTFPFLTFRALSLSLSLSLLHLDAELFSFSFTDGEFSNTTSIDYWTPIEEYDQLQFFLTSKLQANQTYVLGLR